MFQGVYGKRRVLVTGFSGFKGACLSRFLHRLGAELFGVALPMPEPSLWSISGGERILQGEYCDIRNLEKLEKIFSKFRPEIVFHLAARSLVRKSYEDPLGTFSTNVMGTANVLECCRRCGSVRAAVVISSDKCYENRETIVPYTEKDPLGGHDPYSASKGCTEIVVSSYRKSFFPPEKYGISHRLLLASCRAGNVIGGGDYASDRLVPDLVRGALAGKETILRNPDSVRPWQHVWEPLSGYLALGAKLLSGEKEFASCWNFGPGNDCVVSVREASFLLGKYWDKIQVKECRDENAPHEACFLLLDSTKARTLLHWKNVWDMEKSFQATARWYRAFHEKKVNLLEEQLEEYICDAANQNLEWSLP